MKLKSLLEKDFLSDEFLNLNCFLIAKESYKKNLIHASYTCLKLDDDAEELYYYILDAHYSNLDISKHNYVSLNNLKNDKVYCQECVHEVNFEMNSNAMLVNFETTFLISLVSLMQNIEGFLSNDFITGKSFLTEGFELLKKLNIFKEIENVDSFSLKTERRILDKLRFSDEGYPVNDLVSFHEKLIQQTIFLVKDYNLLHLLENEKLSYEENKNKFVLFSTHAHDITSVFDAPTYSQQILLKKVYLNPVFTFGDFAILPYFEYKLYEAAILRFAPSLGKVAVFDSQPTANVLETFKGLYDESNEALKDYKTVAETALTI